MKTKRFAKIALSALAAALLICTAIGISVSAETDEPSVSVAEKRLSYNGAAEIVYYVEAENFDESAYTLKMDFWTPSKSDGQNPSYTKELDLNNVVEKDGKKYYAFYSNGIAPIDMTKPTYAEAYILSADGTELARSATADYSVYAYAMNTFSASPTDDQTSLYTALLDYSAAVQSIFPDKANVEKYGWADAYYYITEYVYVDGALDEEASLIPDGAKRPSELADKLTDDGYLLAYANSTVGDAIFKGMTDGNGVSYSSPFATPGVHTYNISYTTKGMLNTFEGMTSVEALFENGTYVVSGNNYYNGNLYVDSTVLNALDRTDTIRYMALETGIGKDGNASTYIVSGTSESTGCGWKIDINDGTIISPSIGVTYIIDFDFKISEFSYTGETYDTMVYMGINSVIGDYTTTGNSGKNFIDFNLFSTAAGENQTQNIGNNTAMVLTPGEWNDIRIVYEVISVDDPDTSDNEALASVKYYINGLFGFETTTTDMATPEAFYVEMRSKAYPQQYCFDNIYFGGFGAENVKGAGKYYTGELTADNSIIYDFDDITVLDSSVIGYYNGTKLNTTTSDNYLAVVDGELVAGTNGASEDGTWGAFTIKGTSNTGNDGELGTKYIFETDFKFVGGSGREEDARISYSFGLNSKAAADSSSTSFADFELYDGGNGTLLFGADSEIALRAGQWYNILFEYEITANGFKINGSTSYDGKLNVYVNGELAVSKTVESSVVDVNKLFESFYFEHNGTDTEFIFDNMYMGVIPNAGTRGTGVYYTQYLNGKLSEATVWDFDKGATITTGENGVMLDNNGDYQFNNYIPYANRTQDPHYYDRHVLVTGAGSMKIGSETQWANTTINAKNIALEVGETGIFETDFLFSGSDAQVGYLAEFYVWNSSNTSIATMSVYPGSKADGTSVKLKSSSGPELQKNTWYNILVTITRTEDGCNVVYYLDGVEFAREEGKTSDASVIRGAYWTSRVSGAMYQSFLFDNILFANTSNILADGEKVYNSYLDRYNDGLLDADNTVFYGFGEGTTLAKGEGEILASTTTATLTSPTGSYDGPYVYINNEALNLGITGTTVTGEDSTNYGVDINAGVSATIGQTYIAEFDFTFNSSAWNTDSSQHLILAMRMYTVADSSGNMATMAGVNGNRTNPNGDGIGDSITVADPTYISSYFAKGATYKIRIEISITSATTATVNYYVDNNLLFAGQAKTFTEGRFDTLNIFRITLYKRAEADYTIDNILFTVIDTPVAEE